MKSLLFTLLIVLSTTLVKAQVKSYDSLEQRVIRLEGIANTMHSNMNKTGKQFFLGAALQLVGASLLYIATNVNSEEDKDKFNKIGAGTMMVGFAVSISAMSHLERGGNKRKPRN